MTSHDLRTILKEFDLTQSDLARLLGVTPRAVALWLAEERAIPGPVEAYVRLFQLLPLHLRQVELSRLTQKGSGMRDGMFGVTFEGHQGTGMGVLVFDQGRVYGTDTDGVRFDGAYLFHAGTGVADVQLKVTFPPHVVSVLGIANPYEWAFDVTTTFDPHQNAGNLKVQTSIGQRLDAQYVFLRSLPDAV